MINANEVIERLCKLQEEVQNHINDDGAADCFCRKGGFWHVKGYGGTHEEGYRNDGDALEFIENAVREKINAERGRQ
jgi:hypothetical protein